MPPTPMAWGASLSHEVLPTVLVPPLVCDVVDTTLRLAVIPGDGIGTEVVAEGLKVLDAALGVDGGTGGPTPYDLGAARWHRTGETLPDAALEELRQHDAILLGAV